jgi:hypothetical protein
MNPSGESVALNGPVQNPSEVDNCPGSKETIRLLCNLKAFDGVGIKLPGAFHRKYRVGHKSLDKNAFKSEIFMSSDVWPTLSCILV